MLRGKKAYYTPTSYKNVTSAKILIKQHHEQLSSIASDEEIDQGQSGRNSKQHFTADTIPGTQNQSHSEGLYSKVHKKMSMKKSVSINV